MGLDMYISKAKRIGDATVKDLVNIDNYFSYKNRGDAYKKCSMYRWCGINYRDVNKKLAKLYKDEYKNRYSLFDINHKYYSWKSIYEEVAYWRKANAIHRWFVDNIQNGIDDCGTYEVTQTDLENLLETVEKVLGDHDLADDYLPTQSGFFFGSTDYDEYYFEDLKETKNMLQGILDSADFEHEIYMLVKEKL